MLCLNLCVCIVAGICVCTSGGLDHVTGPWRPEEGIGSAGSRVNKILGAAVWTLRRDPSPLCQVRRELHFPKFWWLPLQSQLPPYQGSHFSCRWLEGHTATCGGV